MPQALSLWFELFTLMLSSMYDMPVKIMNYVAAYRRYPCARKSWGRGKRAWEKRVGKVKSR